LQVDIRVYPRNASVVRGHAVDISESGISALLTEEIPIGEVVRLEFSLPMGDIETHALVRHKEAFRYGLQFVETSSTIEVIGRTCGQLAMEESLREAKRF
jgi:c-di-GMP-binding flagellar brake protein YcgR